MKIKIIPLLLLPLLISFSLGNSLKASFENHQNLLPVAIIGSGVAGLSAGMVLSLNEQYSVVFAGPDYGGALNVKTRIGNWPGIPFTYGNKVIDKLLKQVERYNLSIVQQTIKAIDFNTQPFVITTESGDSIRALSIILCTGTKICIPDIPGVQKYLGRGIYTEPGEDAHDFKDKHVIILGAGDAGVIHAHYALTGKAASVKLIGKHHLTAAKWRNRRIEQMARVNSCFEILLSKSVTEILGNGKVTHVRLNSGETLPADIVLLATGRTPLNDLYKKAIELDAKGYVLLKNGTQETNIPGVFAAGDNAGQSYGQAAIAAGDGMKAGYNALNYLESIGFTHKQANGVK